MSPNVFRTRQRVIEDLIDAVEHLVMDEALEVPAPLRERIALVLERVYGREPAWLADVVRPTSMLDHLFVAEGRLRSEFYSDRDIDLDESPWIVAGPVRIR